MKPTSQKTLDMLASGYQKNPQSMLVVDIDPPFVGTDFNQAGSDPSLFIYQGTLYLTFVDGDYIKVAIVDQSSYKVIGLLRTIEAPGAGNPRLTFETSIYPGLDDLPHVVYTVKNDKKVMAYREQYNEKLEIVQRYDEIGQGVSIDVIKAGRDIYHFYVGCDGRLYMRKQGEYANVLIEPEAGGEITAIRALQAPDGRVCLVYSLTFRGEGGAIRTAYSNLALSMNLDGDGVSAVTEVTSVEFEQAVFFYEGAVEAQVFTEIGLVSSIKIFSDDVVPQVRINDLTFPEPVCFGESLNPGFSLVQLALSLPYYYDESIEATASLQSIEFT